MEGVLVPFVTVGVWPGSGSERRSGRDSKGSPFLGNSEEPPRWPYNVRPSNARNKDKVVS